MRKVTKQAVLAFLNRRPGNFSNTSVTVSDTIEGEQRVELRLHGNLIAFSQSENGHFQPVKVSFAGWQTPTTKERLNGLVTYLVAPAAGFYQKNFQLYYRDGNGNNRAVGAHDWVELV